MSHYERLVPAFDHDRWHHCLVVADACEEDSNSILASAWRWIAKWKRWPYKHKTRALWGWYCVPLVDGFKVWADKRESAVPNVLIGGPRRYHHHSRRRTREGPQFLKNVFRTSISECMSALAVAVAFALLNKSLGGCE